MGETLGSADLLDRAGPTRHDLSGSATGFGYSPEHGRSDDLTLVESRRTWNGRCVRLSLGIDRGSSIPVVP